METIKRLDPDEDKELIREALSWIEEQPRFFRDADKAWRDRDELELMKTQADYGIFNGELIAVITIAPCGEGFYEGHLKAKKGADPEPIIRAGKSIVGQLFERGLKQAGVWVAAKNYGVRRILEAVGLRRDGLELHKGQSHGQPIKWLKYVIGEQHA